MTKKDYELIARALKRAHENVNGGQTVEDGAKLAAEYLADALAQDNPRFDRERFLTACEVQS